MINCASAPLPRYTVSSLPPSLSLTPPPSPPLLSL